MRGRIAGLLVRSAQALGLNAVPVAGFLGAGWSAATALAVYWVESVLVILFVALRISLHRRLTRRAGHFRAPGFTRGSASSWTPPGSGTLLRGYLGIAIPFTLVHGLFLAALLFLLLPGAFGGDAEVSPSDLGRGAIGVLVLLAVGFAIDLPGLGRKSFRWIELLTQRALGRVLVVHLTIVFGMMAAAYFEAPAGLFLVFAGLKTLVDLGNAAPHREPGLEPPRWLRFLDRIPSRDGESFSASWRLDQLRAQRIQEENERVLDSPAAPG